MAAAFEDAFGRGVQRAALIGSDVPAPSRHHVREAFDALGTHDVVLGPARDGGYYLVALDRPRPELFAGMAWSTPEVLHRAARLGLRVTVLETLGDVDTIEDVRREWTRGARKRPCR